MKIALLAGAVALAGLSSSAPAQGGGPNCNACFDSIRSDVAAVGQQVSGVQAGVTQSQQSLVQVQQGITTVGQQVTGVQAGVTQSAQRLDQVWNGVGDVSRGVSGLDNRVLGIASQVSGVQARAAHIQQLADQLRIAVDQAHLKLDRIVANPPATPPPAVPAKKSAVSIEFEHPNLRPNGTAFTGTPLVKAHLASAKYCKEIGYADGRALGFAIDGSPTAGNAHVNRLVCFD